MSHQVKVKIAVNFQYELNKIATLKNEIHNIDKTYSKHLKIEINKVLKKIIKIEKMIKSIDDQTISEEKLKDYLINISSSIKEVANLKYSINYGKALVKEWEVKENEIKTLIKKYGVVAMLCLEDLQNEGIAITTSNLKQRINQYMLVNAKEEQIKIIINNLKIMLIKSKLPEEIKTGLIKQLRDMYTYQQLGDLTSYFEQTIKDFETMKSLAKSVVKALAGIDFQHQKFEYKFLEDGIMKIKIISYKDTTKDFAVNIYSDHSMDWKFGNYEEHLCDADGEKFRLKLKDYGISTTIMNITRNVSSVQHLKQRASRASEK